MKNFTRRGLSVLLSVVLVFTALPLTAVPASAVHSLYVAPDLATALQHPSVTDISNYWSGPDGLGLGLGPNSPGGGTAAGTVIANPGGTSFVDPAEHLLNHALDHTGAIYEAVSALFNTIDGRRSFTTRNDRNDNFQRPADNPFGLPPQVTSDDAGFTNPVEPFGTPAGLSVYVREQLHGAGNTGDGNFFLGTGAVPANFWTAGMAWANRSNGFLQNNTIRGGILFGNTTNRNFRFFRDGTAHYPPLLGTVVHMDLLVALRLNLRQHALHAVDANGTVTEVSRPAEINHINPTQHLSRGFHVVYEYSRLNPPVGSAFNAHELRHMLRFDNGFLRNQTNIVPNQRPEGTRLQDLSFQLTATTTDLQPYMAALSFYQLHIADVMADFAYHGVNIADLTYQEVSALAINAREAFLGVQNAPINDHSGTMLPVGRARSAFDPFDPEIMLLLGLPTQQEAFDFVDKLLQARARFHLEAAEFFHCWTVGVMTQAPSAAFNTPFNIQFDPRPVFGAMGYNLASLQLLLMQATSYHAAASNLYANHLTDPELADIWARVNFEASMATPPFMINVPAQAAWLANLQQVVNAWQLHEFRELLGQSLIASDNFHAGAEYGDGNFEDSVWVYPTPLLVMWRDTMAAGLSFVDVMRGAPAFTALVDAIFTAAFLYEVEGRVEELNLALWYRDEEEEWYTFRDFFIPLLTRDWNRMSSSALLRFIQGPLTEHRDAYLYNKNTAEQVLGERLAWEIYGDFYERIIAPLMIGIYLPLAYRFAREVHDAMGMVQSAISPQDIATWDGVLNCWETFVPLRRIIIQLDDAIIGLLDAVNLGHLLGVVIDGYPRPQLEADLAFLTTIVLGAIDAFLANPPFATGAFPPALRSPMQNDILPGHLYYDANNAAMLRLIQQLDMLLGDGGNIAPLVDILSAFGLDVSDLIDVVDLTQDPLNLSIILEQLLTSMLYSDAALNLVTGMLYPIVLEAFEQLWDDEIRYMVIDNVTEMGITITNIRLHGNPLYTVLRSGTFANLRLYPSLLAGGIAFNDANPLNNFPEVRTRLMQSPSHEAHIYPSNAWSREVSPALYDADGNFYLPWFIAYDQNGVPRSPADRQERFRNALAQVLGGMFPLVQALLFNRDVQVQAPVVGRVTGGGSSIIASVTLDNPVNLVLTLEGSHGYANVLTPILEVLLGDNIASIPLPATLQGAASANARAAVDAIFDPIDAFIANIQNNPVSSLIALIPNLAYAFSLDRILPLLDELQIGISYEAFVSVVAIPLAGAIAFAPIRVPVNLDGTLDPINIGDILAGGDDGLDLSMLSDFNNILGILAEALDVTLPVFNTGLFASLGTLRTSEAFGAQYIPTRRGNPNDNPRLYIDANQGQVLNALLQWLLGSGLLPLEITTAREAAAAIAELVLPQHYPVTPVQFGPPLLSPSPFPAWWALEGPQRAHEDGRFLVENADTVLNVLWNVLTGGTGQSLAEGINEIMTEQLINGLRFYELTGTIHTLLNENLNEDLIDLSRVLLVNGEPIDLNATIESLRDLDAVADWSDLIDAAPADQRLDVFATHLADFLEPLGPILDVVFAGATLGLINTGDGVATNSALLQALGYNGYENALLPIIMAFAEPLGVAGNIVTAAQFNAFAAGDYRARIEAVLSAVAEIYRGLLTNPIAGLLSVIPNLAYFISPCADGNASPLQQSLNNLLHPLYVLADTARPLFDVLGLLSALDLPAGLNIGASGFEVDLLTLADSLLADLLGELDLPLALELNLRDFVLMLPCDCCGNDYVPDQPAVLFALLRAMGVLGFIEENGMEGLTRLIRHARFPGSGLIDYAFAPAAAAPVVYPDWFTRDHAEFLADNADAVIHWIFDHFIAEPAVADVLSGLLGGIELMATLEDTIDALFGHDVFVRDNLVMIAGLLAGLRGLLDGIEIPAIDFLGTQPLPLIDAIAQLVEIYDEETGAAAPLCLATMFAPIDAFLAAPPAINSQADFMAVLTNLLLPFVPLARVFLAESNILIIRDPAITSGDNALLRVFGYNGYETGLLPLLAGLGAGVPGFLNELAPYSAFRPMNADDQIAAVLNPILFLLQALVNDPVSTLLTVLPNLAYLLSDAGGRSIFQQALDNILHPLTVLADSAEALEDLLPDALRDLRNLRAGDAVNELLAGIEAVNLALEDLLIGAVQVFAAPWDAMGVYAQNANGARFLAADRPDLLTQLLQLTGAFDLLEENNLTGLVRLLNTTQITEQAERINYCAAPGAQTVAAPEWFAAEHAQFLAENAAGVLNWAWRVLLANNPEGQAMVYDALGIAVGNSLEETLQGLLGSTLYSEEIFTLIIDFVLGLQSLWDDFELLGMDLPALLGLFVSINGAPLDLNAIFDAFESFDPGSVTDEASFRAGLNTLLLPAVPLLRVLLFGDDVILIEDADINNGDGLLRVQGGRGYESGLLPILLGLGADLPGFSTVPPGSITTDQDVIDAIVEPLLFVLNSLVQNPVGAALHVLPNAARFISDANGPSLLQQAIDNILFPLTNILGELAAAEGLLPELLTDLRAGELVNNLLADLLGGIGFLSAFTIEELIVGDILLLPAPLNELGRGGLGTFVSVNQADFLTQLLQLTGAFGLLEENNLTGLLRLLNTAQTATRADRINYCIAPGAQTVAAPEWFAAEHAQFLAENAAGVLNWAWRVLLANNPEGQAMVYDALGVAVGNSLEETLQGLLEGFLRDLLGDDFRDTLVWMLEPLAPILRVLLAEGDLALIVDNNVAGGAGLMRLPGADGYRGAILPILLGIGADVPGFIASLVSYEDFVASGDAEMIEALVDPLLFLLDAVIADPVNTLLHVLPNAARFLYGGETSLLQQAINNLLHPLEPIRPMIDDMLAGSGNGDPTDPVDPTDPTDPPSSVFDQLRRIADQILSIELMGIYLVDLLYETVRIFDGASHVGLDLAEMLSRITQSLPGPAISPMAANDAGITANAENTGGFNLNNVLGSLLDIDALLYGLGFGLTLRGLIIGDILLLPAPLNELGRNDLGTFVSVNQAGFLTWLLQLTGAFDLLEENNLTGLIRLLGGQPATPPGPIVFPVVNTTANRDLYTNWWWTQRQALSMLDRGPKFLDQIFGLIMGSTLDAFLYDLIGDALFTQSNFESIVELLQGLIPDIAGTELIPGRTLGDVLNHIVAIDGEAVAVTEILAQLQGFVPGEITGAESFAEGLVDFLLPAAPLLRFLLTGANVTVLGGEAGINNGEGLLTLFGFDGYSYGVVPIFEAFLMPLDAQSEITPPAQFRALADRDMLEALLHPVLFAVETLVEHPINTLLTVVPNLAYFISCNGSGSLLQETVGRLLFPIDSVIYTVLGESGLLNMLDVDLTQLIDNGLRSLGLPNINIDFLLELRLGTLTAFTSLNGHQARYVRVSRYDQADLLTTLLRQVFSTMRDANARRLLVDLIGDALGLGPICRFLVRAMLSVTFFFGRWLPNSTAIAMRFTFGLMRLIMWMMPLLNWLF